MMREAVPVTIPVSNPLIMQRRSAVELTLPLASGGRGTPSAASANGAPGDDFGLDASPLDVPAFLRRQN